MASIFSVVESTGVYVISVILVYFMRIYVAGYPTARFKTLKQLLSTAVTRRLSFVEYT